MNTITVWFRGFVRILVGVCITIFITGCMTVDFAANDFPLPVMMNAPRERTYTVVTHFSVEQDKSLFFVKRIFGGAHPDITKMLQKQLQKTPGDAIINFRIKGETKEIDLALPIIFGAAGAFAYPPLILISLEPLFADLKSYTVEGDIIRFTDRPRRTPPPVLFDPDTGLPMNTQKPPIEYDPDTGLPRKQP